MFLQIANNGALGVLFCFFWFFFFFFFFRAKSPRDAIGSTLGARKPPFTTEDRRDREEFCRRRDGLRGASG